MSSARRKWAKGLTIGSAIPVGMLGITILAFVVLDFFAVKVGGYGYLGVVIMLISTPLIPISIILCVIAVIISIHQRLVGVTIVATAVAIIAIMETAVLARSYGWL